MAGCTRKNTRGWYCEVLSSTTHQLFAFWAASYKVLVLCVYSTVSALVNAAHYLHGTLLGAFVNLRKMAISFVMPTCLCACVPNSPCLSLLPHGKAGIPLDRFS